MKVEKTLLSGTHCPWVWRMEERREFGLVYKICQALRGCHRYSVVTELKSLLNVKEESENSIFKILRS